MQVHMFVGLVGNYVENENYILSSFVGKKWTMFEVKIY